MLQCYGRKNRLSKNAFLHNFKLKRINESFTFKQQQKYNNCKNTEHKKTFNVLSH